MNKESKNKVWLGIFVIAGLAFLSVMLYSLGDRRNLFDQTIQIKAIFSDVSGLRPGNSVRLSGVNVGTVEQIEIISDSLVMASMIIQSDAQEYIKKNATASIVTDGLMGNRLVLIHPGKSNQTNNHLLVEEGDTLKAEPEVQLEDMLTILEKTNANLSLLAADLVDITHKVSSGEGSLGKLISDPDLINGLEEAIGGIQSFSIQGVKTLSELNTSIKQINEGEGLIGALLSDSNMTKNLSETLVNLQETTDEIAGIGEDLQELLQYVKSGEGTAGAILTNPNMAIDLEKSLMNIREGSDQFNEVMEAMKHSILFRRYFRKNPKEANLPEDYVR